MLHQLIINLPSQRVTPNSTFLISGIDFCGSSQRKYKNQRNGTYSKTYVTIFICISAKNIHLETTIDLFATEFITALKKFCARIGKVNTLTSDSTT